MSSEAPPKCDGLRAHAAEVADGRTDGHRRQQLLFTDFGYVYCSARRLHEEKRHFSWQVLHESMDTNGFSRVYCSYTVLQTVMNLNARL